MSSPELTVKYFNSASNLPVSIYDESGRCIASSGALGKGGRHIVEPIVGLPGNVHYRVTDEWMIAGYVKDDKSDLLYVLGPALIAGFDRFAPQKYVRTMGFPVEKLGDLWQFLENLPRMDELRFRHQLMLLHYILYGAEHENEKLIDVVIANRNHLPAKPENESEEENQNNYELEKQTLEYIENGDLAGMKGFLRRKISSGGVLRKTSDDFLRSSKNNLIKTAALASRAAIKSGVDYAYATKIADNYVFQAERLNSARDVFSVNSDMLLKYTELAHVHKSIGTNSKLVHDVVNYINANVFQKISLDDISDALGLSVGYISRKFKEDSGIALNKYVTQYKLDKAKSLLLSTDMSITEIAYSLGFSTQNYFHKVFKGYFGKTPMEFRSKVSFDDD